VSVPTLLIIEPDIDFARKLQDALNGMGYLSFLRTDVEDPHQIVETGFSFQAIILNLELKSIEGLSLYSYLKKSSKFRKTAFIFLTDNNNILQLLDKMFIEDAVVLNKKLGIKELVTRIINNIPFPDFNELMNRFYTELKGSLELLPVRTLLAYCENTCFNGFLYLLQKNSLCAIKFNNGKVKSVYIDGIPQSEYNFEIFQSWAKGEFRLERFRYNIFEIKHIFGNEINSSLTAENGEITIDLNDIFTDLFYFLSSYLQDQLPDYLIDQIIVSAINDFKLKNELVKYIHYDPTIDEKFVFDESIKKEHIPYLIDLFQHIFLRAKSHQIELDFNDLFEHLRELEPYLKQINFYNHLLKDDIKKETTASLQNTSIISQ